ncbi:unnamed protein product [Protopolystoma xenopodis]|uniref:Uncharacterized protein n=1 Tax=Protopolystoma xenopodis TaxID=117903 RepID=A0A448WS30_9PLAT|nr:unnamed protein product [Protopolystoma xenopodis]
MALVDTQCRGVVKYSRRFLVVQQARSTHRELRRFALLNSPEPSCIRKGRTLSEFGDSISESRSVLPHILAHSKPACASMFPPFNQPPCTLPLPPSLRVVSESFCTGTLQYRILDSRTRSHALTASKLVRQTTPIWLVRRSRCHRDVWLSTHAHVQCRNIRFVPTAWPSVDIHLSGYSQVTLNHALSCCEEAYGLKRLLSVRIKKQF